MSRRNPLLDAVLDELARIGATNIRREKNAHIRVTFAYAGRDWFTMVSSTPGDRNAGLASVASLRQMLGIKREVVKSERRQRYRATAPEQPAALPAITAGRDGFATLLRHPVAAGMLEIRANDAWRDWFDPFLVRAGHIPVRHRAAEAARIVAVRADPFSLSPRLARVLQAAEAQMAARRSAAQ